MKNKVVVQYDDYCRVLINPEPSEYEHLPHVVNPNLALVRGLPPEEWKIVGGIVAAENPALLPPVEQRSYEAVQEDFMTLRCEVSARLNGAEAELRKLEARTHKALKILGISVAVVAALLASSIAYMVRS